MRRLLLVTAAALPAALVTSAFAWTRAQARGRVLDVPTAPQAPWAVVLGAGVNDDGTPINTLRYRLDRALELFAAGKAERILVTGGVRPGADEITAMTGYLLRHGVPEERITRDPWGNNTFNSAQRAAKVYGVRRALVVTQRFHVHRAVALFRDAGVDAYGVADEEGRRERSTWRTGVLRELASNVKAMSDALTGRPYLSPETGPAPFSPDQPTHAEVS